MRTPSGTQQRDDTRPAASARHDDNAGDYERFFHDDPKCGRRSRVLSPWLAPAQAVSRSRRRWLTTLETPSPRMLIPYSESAISIVRFWCVMMIS
jgi:hypothetical protein